MALQDQGIGNRRGKPMKYTKEKATEIIGWGRAFVHGVEMEEDYCTDQEMHLPQPPLVKAPMTRESQKLPMDFAQLSIKKDFLEIINERRSNRVYTQEGISLLELSYLLWCTQGVKDIRGKAYATLRTVPSGGARHAFECYLVVQKVEGLKSGLYHYLSMGHEIEMIGELADAKAFISESLGGQKWTAKADVIFYYSFVCYRAEWRYGAYAHRVVLMDAGHVTENLYLACTALGLGTCAVGALNGRVADQAFGLDGEEEYIFYAQPVGTIRAKDEAKEQEHYRFVEEEGY